MESNLPILLPILLGLIPANIAKDKGRNFYFWWVYGTLFFIIALIHSIVMGSIKEELIISGIERNEIPLKEIPDEKLIITDLLRKYEITFKKDQYIWNGEVYESYKIPLQKAQALASGNEGNKSVTYSDSSTR